MFRKKLRMYTIIGVIFTLIGGEVSASIPQHIRGHRYCEVLLSTNGFTFDVYNTLGLNDCPDKLWKNMTVDNVRKETGARAVILNGPRFFMMDRIKNTALIDTKSRSFNGLNMRLAGVLHLKPRDLLNTESYREHKVDRHTTWVFDAHKRVYELIDAKGQVFVMQSYSNQYTRQTIKSLATLGDHLVLPKGWRFRTGLIKKTQEVVAVDDKAVVVQDDRKNTYQLAAKDFLD